MKGNGMAYFLALLGLCTPVAGLHRFYLGKPLTGLFYLLTWGFFGIGTIVDLFHLPRMVEDENRRLLSPGPPLHARIAGGEIRIALPPPGTPKEKLSPEQQILRVAKENQGAVTVAMVAVQTGMSLRQTKKELEKLRKQEFCTIDISTEGAKLYVFDGLRSNKPLELT